MAIGPEATDVAMSANDYALLWKGAIIGGIVTFIVTAVAFVVDKVFADYWYGLSFLKPKYNHSLTGSGFRVFELKGAAIRS